MTKLDTPLSLSLDLSPEDRTWDLSVGFDPTDNSQEVIVKYNGNIEDIAKKYNAGLYILNESLASLTLDYRKIRALSEENEIEYIEMPKLLGINRLQSQRDKSATCISRVVTEDGLTGEGVVIGIIDSGIDIFHPEFLNSDRTTRIKYLLSLSQERVYTEEEINKALADRELGVIPVDSIAHGTAVASVAAGKSGVAPKADLIVASLSRKGSATLGNTIEICRCVKFITDTSLAMKKPVCINLSFGTSNGSHDSRSLFEDFMNDACLRWKTSIIIPTGNEGSAGHHFQGAVRENDSVDVDFVIDVGSSIYLSLWKDYVDIFDLELIAPDRSTTGRIVYMRGQPLNKFFINNCQIYIYFGEPTPYNGDTEIYMEIKPGQLGAYGQWRLKVYGRHVVTGIFDIWLPISESSGMSSFLTPQPNVTLTIPSTATGVITVGGYDSSNNTSVDFSGRGFSRNFSYVKPDIVAPAQKIVVASTGGGYSEQSGTSLAAPFVTGSAALLMQWGIVKGNDPMMYGESIKAFLRYGAVRDAGVVYPSTIWGYGKLCLKNSLDFVKQGSVRSMEVVNEVPPAVSEDYQDFIVSTDDVLNAYLDSLDYVSRCKIDDPTITTVYVKKEQELSFLSKNFIFERPALMGLMDIPTAEVSGFTAVENFSYLGLAGSRIIAVVIDTGIDYLHPDFIYPDNTSKIIAIWDQTATSGGSNNICFGREYTRDEINRALQSDDPLSIVPVKDEIGHGTFLAGLIAGLGTNNPDYKGLASGCELVIVKLKPAKKITKDFYRMYKEDVPTYQSNDVMLATSYALGKVVQLKQPASICIGLGTSTSPHDGTSMLSTYLDRVASKRGICITTCAGNEGNSKHHYRGMLTSDVSNASIEIKSGLKEKGFTLLLLSSVAEGLSFNLISPTGEQIDRISPKIFDFREVRLTLESSVISFSTILAHTKNGSQITIIRFKDPTPGIWLLNISAERVVKGQFDVWLPISAFLEPDTNFIVPSPQITITSPGDSNGIITMGAYSTASKSIYVNSGLGPSRNGDVQPTIVAPGVDVISTLPGGGYGKMTGTSISAAVGTAAAALLLEWGIVLQNDFFMNTPKIKSYLIRGARRRTGIEYPDDRWGFGELDIYQSFKVLRI